jgi:hypothetical protein
MNTQERKKIPWYKSQTKWAGILYAVFTVVKSSTPLAPAVLIEAAITILGIFGARDALSKIGQPQVSNPQNEKENY